MTEELRNQRKNWQQTKEKQKRQTKPEDLLILQCSSIDKNVRKICTIKAVGQIKSVPSAA